MRILLWHGAVEFSVRWQTAFGTRGHDVRRARSVEEAIELLRQQRFDLLLFDIEVGEESGLTVAFMAEVLQPDIRSILVSDRMPSLHSDIFSRLSGLQYVLGTNISVGDLVAIAEQAGCASAAHQEQKPSPRMFAGG